MPDAQHREPVRFLAFSASLRAESLNSELIRLAATTIEANQGEVDVAAMHDFDVRSYDADVRSEEASLQPPRSFVGAWRQATHS
jgi:NAD(P)H-dependent FMN reductase